MHTFDIDLTSDHATAALRRFLLRRLGRIGLIAIAMMTGCLAYSIATQDFGFATSILVALILLLTGAYLRAYFVRKKQFEEQLARLNGKPITYTLSDAEWSIASNFGTASYKWEMIIELWIDPDLVFLFYNHEAYVTLPTDQIPSEALEFLIGKATRLNLRVTDSRKP